MADPRDDYDQNEAMVDLINSDSQYGPKRNEANQDFDDDNS
jgi:hypothetical protein